MGSYYIPGDSQVVRRILTYFKRGHGSIVDPLPPITERPDGQCEVDLVNTWSLIEQKWIGSDAPIEFFAWATESATGWAATQMHGGEPGFVVWVDPAEPKLAKQQPDVQKAILRNARGHSGTLRVAKCKPPGRYHPRVWRGPQRVDVPGQGAAARAQTSRQRLMLEDRLHRIFEYVEPDAAQLDVFALAIREVLLLACMEVESGWQSVWTENKAQPGGGRTHPDRRDYVRLAEPLQLPAYKLRFASAPGLGTFRPFASWTAAPRPPGSAPMLPWYDAYNETKHNREATLHVASLRHAMDAVAAVFIMDHAQFGAVDRSALILEAGPMFEVEELIAPPDLTFPGYPEKLRPLRAAAWIPVPIL